MPSTPRAPMLPSNTRLLHAVRATLDEVAQQNQDAALRHALTAADVALNELMLREDVGIYREIYASLRVQLTETATLLEGEGRLAGMPQEIAALPAELDPDVGFAAAGAAIRALLGRGEQVVRAAGSAPAGPLRAAVDRLLATERALHDRGATQAPRPGGDAPKRGAPTPEALQAYLRARWPGRPDLVVTDFRRLVGGFQKMTILFDTQDSAAGAQSYVMRAEKDEERFLDLPASDIADEYRIVMALVGTGIPIAEPLLFEGDAARLTRRFIVSRKVIGESYGSAVETRNRITDAALRSFVETLAAIHAVPTAPFADTVIARWLTFPTLAANTRQLVRDWQKQLFLDRANPSPMIARIFKWLEDNVPEEDAAARLVHTDYGPHNILVRDERIAAVLDWEAPRIGDPAEDLSYFVQCTAAQVDPEQARALYEQAAGYRISDYRLRYFDVYNLIKILVGSASAAAMMEERPDAGAEWCLLAFRYMSVVAGTIEAKIAAAEAARGR